MKRIAVAAALLCAGLAAHAATVTTVDEKTITGTITALSAAELKVTADNGAVSVKAEDIASIVERPVKPVEGAQAVRLRNGDVIRGSVAGGAGEKLLVKSASLGEIAISVSDADCLVLDPGKPPEAAPTGPAHEKDELVLRNGDNLPGVLVAFGKESLTFDCSLGKVDIPFSRIRSVKFAAVGDKYREPDALILSATCVDGSTITGPGAELAGQEISIRSTLGKSFKFPISQLASIEFKNGRLIYLSDMDPADVKEIPMFDERPWHYQRDRSAAGNPIKLNGKVSRKGIGVHSHCELSYDLAGKFRKFISEIGIDDEVDGGNVEVKVLLDGKQVFPKTPEKLLVSKKTGPVPVEIDVAGAKKLTLIVDFGEELHVNDHADWANARLLK